MLTHLNKIKKLVGSITEEQLRYVDCFTGEDVALFMPVAGPCFYALTPEHSHPSYMFVLPFNDQTSLKINGRIITAEHGKLFCLSPDIVHHELPSDYPPRYIAVFINKGFFEKQMSLYPPGTEIVFHGETYDTAPDLLSLLKRFMIEAGNKNPGCDAVLYALSLEICHRIIRGILSFAPLNDPVSSRLEINRVIEYMHSNLDRKITIKELAGIACAAPSHFSRIFKKEIEKTPMDYLSLIRMERVKKLLLAGDKSITEIAVECGFGSSSYLSACFHKKFKTSPSAYCKKDRISKKKNSIPKA